MEDSFTREQERTVGVGWAVPSDEFSPIPVIPAQPFKFPTHCRVCHEPLKEGESVEVSVVGDNDPTARHLTC